MSAIPVILFHGFFPEHDRDAVPDRVHKVAGLTLQTGFVVYGLERFPAKGTGKQGQ